MVGPATIMAICVLAASPLKIDNRTEPRDFAVKLMAFQDGEPVPVPSTQRRPKAPLPPVPRDDADEKAPAGATDQDGIPGLAPSTEESAVIPHPPKKAKPAEILEPQTPPGPAERASTPKQPETKFQPAERDIDSLEREMSAPPRRVTPDVDEDLPRSTRPTRSAIPDRPGTAICSDETWVAPDDVCDGSCRHGKPRTWLGGIETEGWLEQGFTLNTLSPRDRSNGPVGFNDRSNDYQLNQLYMLMKREVDMEGDTWDVGGRVDLLYGTDSIYVESRGLETFGDFSPKWNAERYGLAMPQCYAEVYSPWGTGLSMKLGHFYSILDYESAMAPHNFFYSHSYQFVYSPRTFTGLLGATKLGDFTIQAGMTRGDDNWEDNNNDLGFIGSVSWTSRNERTRIALGVDAGRNLPDPDTNIRTLYSLMLEQKLAQRWQYVIQWDLAFDPRDVDGLNGPEHLSAGWYGIANYLYYTINERWKAGTRFEWFRDEGGLRVPGAGRTGDYYELTAGVNWTPNRFVSLRPEVRWDWAGTPDLLPFGDNTRSNQLLLSCDAIIRF